MADLAGVNGQRENFRVVGKPYLPGRLSYAIATGIAKYGADYVVPDMLHAKFLRSPYANAKVVSVDTEKARKIPGVVDIVTWKDEDIKNLSSGRGMGPPQPFLDNIADQEGAEVAVIVVAENEDICEEALRQLDVKWEVLPHIVDILEGRKPDAPVIRPASPGGQDVKSKCRRPYRRIKCRATCAPSAPVPPVIKAVPDRSNTGGGIKTIFPTCLPCAM